MGPSNKPYPKSFIRIGSWNIHGVYEDVNKYQVNKLESPSFLKILQAHDILCLQETHLAAHELPIEHLTEFKAIPHCRATSSNGRNYGGMLLLVRKIIRTGVKVSHIGNCDILGITLKKDFFELPDDKIVWFTYAPPLTSPYLTNKEGVLSVLEANLLCNDGSENTLVLGDLNGKTGKAADYVLDENDKHSPITDIEHYRTDTYSRRYNEDPHPVDKQGRAILEICKSFQMRILNGRTAGDRYGRVTRYPINRSEKPSTIDYAIVSDNILNQIRSFIVFPFTDISDHCCISVNMIAKIKIGVAPAPGTGNPTDVPPPRPSFHMDYLHLYQENLNGDQRFPSLLESIKTRMRTNQNPSEADIDEWTASFNEHLLDNATKSFPCRNREKKGKIRKPVAKPASWFTAACASNKKRLQRAVNKMNKDPFNKHLQQQFLCARKEYRRTCKEAEKFSRKQLLERLLEIDATDPNEFWRTLNKMRQWGKEKPDPSDNIPPDRWSTYFIQLLNINKTQKLEIDNVLPFHPEMDGKITMEELKNKLKISRDGKSFGPDKIIMEYIKYAPDPVLLSLKFFSLS